MARLISIAELAARTSTCENFWRKKIAKGEIPYVRIGRAVRIDESILQIIMQTGVRAKRGASPDLTPRTINT